jgi:hypothetical protein
MAAENAPPAIVINEIMSSNSRTLADADGDFGDWIELFNAGDEAVDLAGWGLSDDASRPFRWVFPSLLMGAGDTLIVWADGKDRAGSGPDETFTLMPAGAVWRFSDNGSDPGPAWNTPSFDDSAWASGPAPLGYGPEPGYVATTLGFGGDPTSKHITTFFRSTFSVADAAEVRSLNLSLWVDDGAIVYLNGSELARENMPAGDPAIDTLTPTFVAAWPTWRHYPLPRDALRDGENTLAARVHQVNGSSSDLAFDLRLAGVRPGRALHTNFSLDSAGERLLLTAPDGTLADEVGPVELPADVSFGRATNGGPEWRYFAQATPGADNATSTGYLGITPAPEFSHASGFRGDPFDLALQSADAGAVIHYTLDGSLPDPQSLGGSTYSYSNSYPNGQLLQGSTESFPYTSPIPIAERALAYGGIKAINTENSATINTPAAWTTDSNGQTRQLSLKDNARLMFGDPSWGDYEITMQARKDGGSEGFLVFVRADGPRYYLINFGGWNNSQHGLQKGWPDGGWGLVAPHVRGSVGSHTWINLRIRCEGNRIRAWLGASLIFDHTDSSGSPYLAGGVGLGTWVTQSRYRNIEVRTLGGALLHSGPPLRRAPLTVVRARAFKDGHLPSAVATRTFFHGPPPATGSNLPLISLAGEEAGLFGYQDGLYVAGAGRDATGTPHYLERGEGWERPLHFAFFEPDGTLALEQDAGARIHGGWTRNLAQKSLRLYARARHGESTFDHPFFPDLPQDRFKRVILRNSGNDNGQTMFRDAMMQRLVEHLPIETQAYRPSVVYLNGNYWGIHNLRERQDGHYLAGNYGLSADDFDILGYDPNQPHHVIQGDASHFDQTLAYLATNNPADPVHYAYLQTRIDTANFADYNLAQIYFNNTDWPGNNNRWWRKRTAGHEPHAAHGHDGRWRWMLFDTDFGFGHAGGHQNNTLAFATTNSIGRTSWPNPEWSTLLLRRLLENPAFRGDFINRYADLLNTAFLPDRVVGVIDDMAAVIEPEMPRHLARWGRPTTLPDWRNQVNTMRNFAQNRPAAAREHLRAHFGLGQDRWVTLDVSLPSAGHILINRTAIGPATPGVNAAAPYPWSGRYFNGVPIRLSAVAAPGFRFSHWQGPGIDGLTTPVIEQITPWSNLSVTAVFEEAREPALMHYWSFNRPDALLGPTFTIGPASLRIAPAPADELTSGTGQGFAGENNQLNEPAGSHLRLNQPLGAVVTLELPTTGYENPVLRYETRRSGQGAGIQELAASSDGSHFVPLTTIIVENDDPVLRTIPLGGIPGANNNPRFALRITFAQGAGGTAGNHRFDNISLSGEPMASTNVPPQWLAGVPFSRLIEGAAATAIDLTAAARDADGDPLEFTAHSSDPLVLGVSVSGGMLQLHPRQRGEAEVTLAADDGTNAAAITSFRVLVYPAAHVLADGAITFGDWSAAAPAGSQPPHLMFLQSERPDPGADAPLLRAYHIPADDAAADADSGFPYAAASRTRINGLGGDGISFINTGRDRDLGGALLALDTRGVSESEVAWLAGTLLPNSRHYAIRLQYRLGIDGPFQDLFDESFTYHREPIANTATFAAALPARVLDQPYLQLLWRYHRVDGDSGPRAQLRLDDIRVGPAGATPPPASFEAWRLAWFQPAELADPAVSGPAADPRDSGVPNLLRHAFGLDPHAVPQRSLPALTRGHDGLRFSHLRLLDHRLIYQVEISQDPAAPGAWSAALPGADLVLESIVPTGDGLTERVTYLVPASATADAMFLRLRVTTGE